MFDDQLAALEGDSKRHGTQGDALDFALLVDGLSAEREQGITIDVAYRYFSSEKRKFIVADTPGHEQYTRNMVTGASTADLARAAGRCAQGRADADAAPFLPRSPARHPPLRAGGEQDGPCRFRPRRLRRDRCRVSGFRERIGIEQWLAIPVSAAAGDNVTARSDATPWYAGPTILDHLNSVPLDVAADAGKPFRMPVQWVNRPNLDFRGFAGQIAAGRVAPGDEVRILPSGRVTRVERIVTAGGDLAEAVTGQSVTLTLADQVDCSRGDVIAAAANAPETADQFEATLVWMDEQELLPGRGYWLKLGTQTVTATVHEPKYEINVNTLDHLAAKTLALNGIGVAEIATDREIVFEPYAEGARAPTACSAGSS